MGSRIPVSRTAVLTAVILLGATACKKPKPAGNPADAIVPAGTPALDLSLAPQILFQVFGDWSSPHVMPVAAVVGGAIKPIGLTVSGWTQLQGRFMAPGTKYTFFREDGQPGELTILRDTTYALPGCTVLKPMAVVQLAFTKPPADSTVEFLASSGKLGPPRQPSGTLMSADDIARIARAIGHKVGERAHLTPAELDSLDFSARMISTGATKAPTLLISFIDPGSGSSRSGPWTGHVFALADSGPNGYEATYEHAVKGDAKTVEFQRLVNHVDLNGNGADEIILEAWKYGSDNDLVVLSYAGGKWSEVLRRKQRWCLANPTP